LSESSLTDATRYYSQCPLNRRPLLRQYCVILRDSKLGRGEAHGEPALEQGWENRKHVFCVMAQTMRRVLVDHARGHQARKRGGEQRKLLLDEAFAPTEERSPDVLALDEAVQRLGKLHSRQEHVVNLRFFGGFTVEETAAVLDVSPETVKLDWRFAKAWLTRELSKKNN
jgi:RNA polymerase sigma factor (TIGR02999 family)